jgi:hypothetical protein
MAMSRPDKLLAALRRLADHPSTPAAEADNARRRISELEAKYPEPQRDRGRSGADGFFPDFFGGAMSDFADWFSRQVDDEILGRDPASRRTSPFTRPFSREDWDNFARSVGYKPPSHPNCRCNACRVEDVHEYGQTRVPPRPFVRVPIDWIALEVTHWMATHDEGPLGRVSDFEVARDHQNGGAVVAWKCPACHGMASCRIDDQLLEYSVTEPAVRERIKTEIYSRLNGDSDNRCSRCSVFTNAEPAAKG